ncbi:hypothetical protein [Acinetobacter indicus]|nr:hypothetical protein [Acinetobacter indicus]
MQPMQFDDADMEQAYQQYIGPMRARETAFFQKIQVPGIDYSRASA